jgi:hypothetical protein
MIYSEILTWVNAHWDLCNWVLLAATMFLFLAAMPLWFRPRRDYVVRLPQPMRHQEAPELRPSAQRALAELRR